VQIRRRRRWLERRPGFGIERLGGVADMIAGMSVLWRLHRARWARAGGTRALPSEAVEGFHLEAATELARRGWARLYLLHADGAPRAALYGFERGGRFAYYQMGHDPTFSQRSVGTVLLATAIEDAFDNGLREFDFLRGPEGYKLHFATSARTLKTVRIARGIGGRLSLVARRGYTLAGAVLHRGNGR
jgi:CelD/BcsL family acetyltransferase involved in cellulose biosynthesis